MLSIDEALKLLEDGERRQWLVADWGWYSEDNGHGGVYIGLIQPDMEEQCLKNASWDVSKGDSLIGFTKSWDEGAEHIEYNYALMDYDSWPLIIYREFHGLAENQYDLSEEFRLYHNLVVL